MPTIECATNLLILNLAADSFQFCVLISEHTLSSFDYTEAMREGQSGVIKSCNSLTECHRNGVKAGCPRKQE